MNHVHQVTQNGWIESGTGGITWNSKPPIGIKLGSFEATPSNQWAGLDVTDYVYSQFDKKEQAGFVVLQSESGLYTNIRSKEYADASSPPPLRGRSVLLYRPATSSDRAVTGTERAKGWSIRPSGAKR
ncbi:DNRLRE domain-containing protein [Paenibacillus sp. GD4]|uniref:CBM96 family carbohydrate-binding protein n=1 Tax=Paenibacillus sp. GD4 TaxID=3068890 RepID=UPI002796E091|nr:DNRLRE domain-containing protein [Paenibacillus sp. GD4]MDQ1911571.1 DNRLRE domain-containing protein [Paenibacillus sp. GD4]